MWEVFPATVTSSRVCLAGNRMKRLGAITMATLVRSILFVAECCIIFSKSSSSLWINKIIFNMSYFVVVSSWARASLGSVCCFVVIYLYGSMFFLYCTV